MQKVELPLRMLMLGDYTGREDDVPVEDREIINVNKDNFDSVMRSMDLGLELNVPNRLKPGEEEMKVNLKISNVNDFHPEQVARQVPELNRMLAMRNLLQDLRNRVVSMGQFRKQLESIVHDKEALDRLAGELDKFVPQGGQSEADATS